MYDKRDKRRIYWLIDEYLFGKINEQIFCDEFYYCYDLELNHGTLTEIESKSFSELSEVSSRFSQFDEDYKLDASAFVNVIELRKKIVEIKEKLQKQTTPGLE
jgi:hypothetical protein